MAGVASFAPAETRTALSAGVRGLLTSAVAAFVLSGVLAILTNIPLLYAGTDPRKIAERVKPELWQGSRAADRRVAEMWLAILASTQFHNTVKGWLLFVAMVLEIIAVVLVALVARELLSLEPG